MPIKEAELKYDASQRELSGTAAADLSASKNKEVCTLAGSGIMMGGFPWIVVTCSGCHKIITVQPMPMVPEMPAIQGPRKSPLAI